MESENEGESCKTFTTLTNFFSSPAVDADLKFEDFRIAENSDSEEEHVESYTYSDESDSNPDFGNTNGFHSLPSTFEDWRNSNGSQSLDLNKLLELNRNENYMLLELYQRVKNFLCETRSKIKKISEKEATKENNMFLGELGAPYFKTKKEKFRGNPNPDMLRRRQSGLLPVYDAGCTSKWSKSECENLKRGVMLTYNLNKQKALLKQISSLKRKMEDSDDKNDKLNMKKQDEIEKLEGEIRNLRAIGINDVPPLGKNEFIDWDHISSEYLCEKHSPVECSSFWHIYLHPHINKSNWSNEENKNILKLAEKYNEQDWDQIALELGTNRSAFTVFMHYSGTLRSNIRRPRFTTEEDRILLQQIELRKIGSFIPWSTIAELLPNRTKTQMIHRYKYYLHNMSQYTSKFSDAEDVMILLLVEQLGRNYTRFTRYLPSKSYMQIKARYENHLRYRRVTGAFTLREDEQIMKIMSSTESDPSILSLKLNRNRLQLRQRYGILKKFFHKNPDKTLKDVPRRVISKKETFRRLEFLHYIVDQFKNQTDIPTLEEIDAKLGKAKVSKNSNNLDKLLVEFFSTSYTIKQKTSEIAIPKIKHAADQIHGLLRLFGITLKIPAEMKKNSTLDVVDLEILNILRYKQQTIVSRPKITEILPPNMDSLLGMRGLLLQNQLYKKCKNQKKLCLETSLSKTVKNNILVGEDVQNMVLEQRNLFMNQFSYVFTWPALLSIECPNEKLTKKEPEQIKVTTKNTSGQKRGPKRKHTVDPTISLPKKQKNVDNKNQKKEDPNTNELVRTSSRLRLKRKKSSENVEDDQVSHVDTINLVADDPGKNVEHLRNTQNESTKNKQIIPPNLVRLDKSQVAKLLKNKNPINIIKISSTKTQEGLILAQNRSGCIEDDDKLDVEKLQKLGANDLVAIADRIKSTNLEKHGVINQNSNCLQGGSLNLARMKNCVNDSLKRNSVNEASRSDVVSRTYSVSVNSLNELMNEKDQSG